MSNYGIVEKNIDNIKLWLSDGLSASKIALKLGCSKISVLKKIHEHKLVNSHKCSVNYNNLLKDKYQLVLDKFNNGTSINQIAKDIGHSDSEVWKLLKKNGIDTYKYKCQYTLDETFFEKIDTEEKAYCLGFWYSDGNVMPSGKIRIGLNSKDEEILVKIKNCMKWTGPFSYKKAKGNKGAQTILNIDRKRVADDLVRLGCVPKKSLIITFPDSTIVPNDLLRHFIRGMFDGDGGFNVKRGKTASCGITSTDVFCKKLWEISSSIGAEPTNFYYRRKNKPTGTLFFGRRKDMRVFCDYIYKDAKIYMNRNYDLYLKLV